MATTTPNYGWPVPTSTDFVKDGATAIEALGDAIDATVFGLPTNSGLVLLNETSFSAVSSFSLAAATFTATYENYKIIMNFTNSVNGATFQSRLRASGTDDTTSNYFNMVQGLSTNNTAQNLTNASQTIQSHMYMNSSQANFIDLDIASPQKTAFTFVAGLGVGQSSPSGAFTSFRIGNAFNATTSFDAMTFIASSGNMTGSYKIYGWVE
jgi:AICAR transformylase/IMP cyclohydrolase PurH